MNLKIYEKTKYNNIYKHRKNGTYAVDLSLGYNSSGKRIRTTRTGFLTEKEAKLFLASQDTKNKLKIETINKQKFQDYIVEYFEWCLYFKKLKPETVRKKKSRFENNIIPFFKDKIIPKINSRDIVEWQIWIKSKNFTDETMRTLERQLNAYLNWLIKVKKVMLENPYSNVERIKVKKSDIKYRTIDEMRILWDFIENDDHFSQEIKLRILCITKLLFFWGFRFGELVGIKFQDIDFDLINATELTSNEIKIHIRDPLYYGQGGYSSSGGKTDESINIIFTGKNTLMPLFNYIKHMQKIGFIYKLDDFVFTNPETQKPFTPETFRRQFNYYLKAANTKHTTFKDLRSSNGTFLLSTNHSIDEVRSRLRHTTSRTTEQYYATFYEKNKAELANDIDKYAI